MVKLGLISVSMMAALYALPVTAQERTVTKVVIKETGLTSHTDDASLTENCKTFKPTVGQVKRYFSRAYPIESRILTHERYSPCFAVGEVSFSDNTSGRFRLYSGGTATLFWLGGNTVDLLYKRNKWHDPFACAYGLTDEPEC